MNKKIFNSSFLLIFSNLILIFLSIFFIKNDISFLISILTLLSLSLVFSYFCFENKTLFSKTLITSFFIIFYFSMKIFEDFTIKAQSFFLLVFFFIFMFILVMYFFRLSKTKLDINLSLRLNKKILFSTIYFSIFFILAFSAIKEPISINFLKDLNIWNSLLIIFLTSLYTAVLEQIIFIGIFFLNYRKIFDEKLSIIFCSILFVFFHLITTNNLLDFFKISSSFYIVLFFLYCVCLFSFMFVSISIFTKKNNSKNLIPSILFHFLVDFFIILILFISL